MFDCVCIESQSISSWRHHAVSIPPKHASQTCLIPKLFSWDHRVPRIKPPNLSLVGSQPRLCQMNRVKLRWTAFSPKHAWHILESRVKGRESNRVTLRTKIALRLIATISLLDSMFLQLMSVHYLREINGLTFYLFLFYFILFYFLHYNDLWYLAHTFSNMSIGDILIRCPRKGNSVLHLWLVEDRSASRTAKRLN